MGTKVHHAAAASTSSAPPSTAPSLAALTAAQITALPEANYNAVIAGLLPASNPAPVHSTTYLLNADTAIYAGDGSTAVARFAKTNFLGTPTVVVAIEERGQFALVLTPARRSLPSASGGEAAAQTEGWVRIDDLRAPSIPTTHVVVSVSAQTLTIAASNDKNVVYKVGVGALNTPTPIGVTGYLQARYLDPLQGQNVYPIQLTSLHSAAADEPYGGTDGGLIGVHYEAKHSGDISHGCVRLPADAIAAVDLLPLGTLVTIVA